MQLQILGLVALLSSAAAFAPPSRSASQSGLFRPNSSLSATPIHAAAAAVPNPFKKLPWNAKKEREREARRLKQETARLHRELGITEDATYEEITAATDSLIRKAGDDVKAKIKIEVAKDKILQIRLNARLAGLTVATKDARAQSNFEVEGADDASDDMEGSKRQAQEWNAPQWMQGIVVKPDAKHVKRQVQIFGGLSFLGVCFSPAIEKMQLFNWMVLVGQLIFRGMPVEESEAAGFGAFGRGSGGSHKKVAWLIGLTLWITSKILIYGLMPSALRGQRYTPIVAFTAENTIFGLAACYLQPYKG